MHALVIGGSGMLAQACYWLAQQGYQVSVIGRNQEKMEKMRERYDHPEQLRPLYVDYHHHDKLRAELRAAQDEHGPFALVVAWIREDVKAVMKVVTDEISIRQTKPWKLYHVVGSRTDLDKMAAMLEIPEGCQYRQVKLGFVIEGDAARWLTHEEISGGVIASIQEDTPRRLIGTVEPWEMRPGYP